MKVAFSWIIKEPVAVLFMSHPELAEVRGRSSGLQTDFLFDIFKYDIYRYCAQMYSSFKEYKVCPSLNPLARAYVRTGSKSLIIRSTVVNVGLEFDWYIK